MPQHPHGAHRPLSAALADHADSLQALAHRAAALDPALGNSLILAAVQAGLAHLAATTLERDLRAANSTLDAIVDDAAEEERAMARRHASARTIAAILAPVLARFEAGR